MIRGLGAAQPAEPHRTGALRPHTMTPATRADRSPRVRDVQRATQWVLRLALGTDAPVAKDCDWEAILQVAFIERCAVLAWARSGETIRREAPAAVVARWRGYAVQAARGAELQVSALVRVVSALETAGLHPVVMKGLPLSQRLYQDPCVRVSTDIDLFVPSVERAAAERVLIDAGWQLQHGKPPFEQLFALATGGHGLVEVQSTVLSDRLSHYGAPPADATRVELGGYRVASHAGDLQPAHLAVHLAKHQLAPLLWWIDFSTLWGQLDSGRREAARAAARAAGLHRYLAWALTRASRLMTAASGDASSLARVGITPRGRTEAHSVWRDMYLAPSVSSAAAALGDWLWPRAVRESPASLATESFSRLKRRWGAALVATERYRDG